MASKFIFLLAMILLLASVCTAGPKLEISEPEFSFGKMVQYGTGTHVYWLKSVGDDTLRVLQIWPGCGCTQIPLEDSTIAPGDSARFEIIFKSGAFRGFVTKTPNLRTNASPDRVYLKFHAEIDLQPDKTTPLRMDPPKIDVSQFSSKTRRRASMKLINVTDDDFTIAPLDTTRKSFVIHLPEVVKAGDTAKVVVIVNEDAVETDFEQSITFDATSTDRRQRYTLPIKRVYRPKDLESTSGS